MKKLPVLFLVSVLLILSSCITRYVKKDRKSYDETFYGYYASRYGDDLVFIGNKFHYVFKDESKQITEFTKRTWKDKLVISSINLSVNKDNLVTGYAVLDVKMPFHELSYDEINVLNKYDFKNKDGNFSKKIDLSGVRYEPRPYSSRDNEMRFKKSYKARIQYKLNHDEEVRKALITPVAMTADGIIILVGGISIPLLVIALTN